MADNLTIKDALGAIRELKTVNDAGVHTPVHRVEGALTDAELRATAVAVSGPITNAQLRASPVSVTGALTDSQLRATAVPVSVAATLPVQLDTTLEVPITSGPFSAAPGVVETVAIPSTATGVRIYARDTDIRFALDGDPAPSVLGNLNVGGIAKAGQWREQRFVAADFADIRFLSTEDFGSSSGGGGITVFFDIEFFGPAS